MKIAIAIPTYNEALNMRELLTALQTVSRQQSDVSFFIYVLDDASPDNTAGAVLDARQNLETNNFKIELIRRKGKEGLGKAYIDGFLHIMAQPEQVDYILQMDADLSHKPSHIPQFIESAENGADFVVGSRYINGGGTPDWKWFRKLVSKCGNWYARLWLGNKLHDYTGGFNMYRVDLLRKVGVEKISNLGYGSLVELKYKSLALCHKKAEIPIMFMDRTYGTSKIPKSTVIKSFILVAKLRLTH